MDPTSIITTASTLAYHNLIETCKSEATRSVYVKAIKYFMAYLRLQPGCYANLLPPYKDPKDIQTDICNFITSLKKRQASYATISLYVAAINKFYLMNDVMVVNWKKVSSFMGEHELTIQD